MEILLNSSDNVRVGKSHPQCFDIDTFGFSKENVSANCFVYHGDHGIKRIEIRKKDNMISTFLFKYTDEDVPEWWHDAEIIFEQGEALKLDV